MLDTLSPDALICVFCEGYIADKIDYTKTQYCVPCNEYKGVTTVREYMEVWA
jgi:ribosomal protein S26